MGVVERGSSKTYTEGHKPIAQMLPTQNSPFLVFIQNVDNIWAEEANVRIVHREATEDISSNNSAPVLLFSFVLSTFYLSSQSKEIFIECNSMPSFF